MPDVPPFRRLILGTIEGPRGIPAKLQANRQGVREVWPQAGYDFRDRHACGTGKWGQILI